MRILIVVTDPKEWPLEVQGVEVVSAQAYLADPTYAALERARVFNFCRSYRYQSNGYYVSLLAAARGHKPVPDISTIQDMKSPAVVRLLSEDLDDLIQRSLADIKSSEFILSIYFGKNLAKRHDRLSAELFRMFQAPFVRARFARTDRWQLQSLGPIAMKEIPDEHRPFVVEVAGRYFAGRRPAARARARRRYDLAILYDPQAEDVSSDKAAIRKFIRAGDALGIAAEVIQRDDLPHLAEYDALFIRETTNVNHYTFRFSRRAAVEGLVVVDDPESILKCTNKVYLAELLGRKRVPIPRTLIVHRKNIGAILDRIGLPCILKQPDSAFSLGVTKAETAAEVIEQATRLLERSDLIIAQEFVPTPFDWRIGVFDGKPLYACKYFMAQGHWQIIQRAGERKHRFGRHETLPVELAPPSVVRVALKAANLIGDGLYGVDLKLIEGKCYVIEVNDNPTIETGVEDQMLKDALYRRVMEIFLQRLERRRQGATR